MVTFRRSGMAENYVSFYCSYCILLHLACQTLETKRAAVEVAHGRVPVK